VEKGSVKEMDKTCLGETVIYSEGKRRQFSAPFGKRNADAHPDEIKLANMLGRTSYIQVEEHDKANDDPRSVSVLSLLTPV